MGARVTPSASATSWACAQVSIRRAVATEAADIGGPNQGNRAPSGASRSAFSSAARPSRQRASSAAGSARAYSSAPSSTYVYGAARACSTSARKPSGSVTAVRA